MRLFNYFQLRQPQLALLCCGLCWTGAALGQQPQPAATTPNAAAPNAAEVRHAIKERKLAELEKKYPLESLAPRLAGAKAARTPVALSPAVAEELDQLESLLTHSESAARKHPWQHSSWAALARHRQQSLRTLHSDSAARFYLAEGAGLSRMRVIPLPDDSFELPKSPTLPLANVTPSALPSTTALPAKLSHEELAKLHQTGQFDFANPLSYGFRADEATLKRVGIQTTQPNEPIVAGFTSHEFRNYLPIDQPNLTRQRPQITAQPAAQPDGSLPTETWQVAQLQLVSLLLSEQPSVYDTTSMPKMEELKTVKRRPLDRFEKHAIESLRAGESLVISEAEPQHIRMVGALRATRQCQACHEVERGTLLGAFSYVLTRAEAKVHIDEHHQPSNGWKPGEAHDIRPIPQLALGEQTLRLVASAAQLPTLHADGWAKIRNEPWFVSVRFNPPRQLQVHGLPLEVAEVLLQVQREPAGLLPLAVRAADGATRRTLFVDSPKVSSPEIAAEQAHLNELWTASLQALPKPKAEVQAAVESRP